MFEFVPISKMYYVTVIELSLCHLESIFRCLEIYLL